MAAAEALYFHRMGEAGLRQWVEANLGRVNDRDSRGDMPLIVAAGDLKSLPLVVWLLDEKGADVDATTKFGTSALDRAGSLSVLNALLDRGADPTIADGDGGLPLMYQAAYGTVDVVARLLQDPRVRATIDAQDDGGSTALHDACRSGADAAAALKVHLFLQAGANPRINTKAGRTPLAYLRQHSPTRHAAIALLEQYPDARKNAEKASLLVKARRIAVAAISNTVAPSCLQDRVARRQPLPRVALMPLTDGQNEGEQEDDKEGEGGRKLHTTLAFMCVVGREGMPRDVFRVVIDLLMPSWDPLRRKDAGAGQPLPQG